MIPGGTILGWAVYLAITLAGLRRISPRGKANLAAANLVVSMAILLNALGNISDEWPNVLYWALLGVPFSAWSMRGHRRAADLAERRDAGVSA